MATQIISRSDRAMQEAIMAYGRWYIRWHAEGEPEKLDHDVNYFIRRDETDKEVFIVSYSDKRPERRVRIVDGKAQPHTPILEPDSNDEPQPEPAST